MFRPSERAARTEMVRTQLMERGIADRRVLAAMRRIPRHDFVPAPLTADAYQDTPLNIGERQTISQPYIVALMTQCAQIGRTDRVLEVGTGSGYHTAILAYLAGQVWSLERIQRLHELAQVRLNKLRARNVTLIHGNGVNGYEPAAPYDAIIVAAATDRSPSALLGQLADGGRLVIPLGPSDRQELTVVRREAGQWRSRSAGGCRFVPLLDS